ncbi:MAG: 2-hydroxyacyl-CoA dehydratase [Promethearchaeota archaeon]
MSIYADDVVNFTSVLKMSYNFLTGKEYVKRKRGRERRKVISVALGFPDLVFAVGAIPVFPIRLESFKINKILLALNSAKTVLGWNLTSKVLDLVRQFDILKLVDKILEDVIESINEKYNEVHDLGVKSGIPENLCFGVKTLYGMHESIKTELDANLNFAMRCGEWNKYSESLKDLVPNQIWVNLPSSSSPNNEKLALEQMVENINKAIEQLEELTGNIVTDESLRKQFRIGNQVKRYYKKVLHEISISDFYPCNPATFAEILALLTLSFQDYNSNAQRYLENISQLVKEMKERINKGIGMDVSDMPRLLLFPVFAGFEPKCHEIIYELGGRTLYADWDVFGLLEEIPVSNKIDPIEEYARFLLNSSRKGIGCDDKNLTDSCLKAAREFNIDGIIFNRVFGCSSLSNIYDSIIEKSKKELGIPAITINFSRIGENIEDAKNRLRNFMELFK